MNSLSKYFPSSKKISIDKFISNALYNKSYGYYSKKNPFGKNGDFITSPGITSLFGELIALWIVSLWEHMNKPKIFNIVELGPGNGQMCKTFLNVFKKFPIFFDSANVFLYEKSRSLQDVQKYNISNQKVKWIKNFNKIKKGPVIFLGNEFFDAIPIKQFKKINNTLYEKYVRLESNSKIKTFLKKANSKTIIELKKNNLLKNQSFVEYPKQGLAILDLIINKIKRQNGGLLLIDYGFLKPKNKNTLQSVKRMNFKEKSDLYFRVQRLVSPKQMGELFKFLFASKLKKKFLLGFN